MRFHFRKCDRGHGHGRGKGISGNGCKARTSRYGSDGKTARQPPQPLGRRGKEVLAYIGAKSKLSHQDEHRDGGHCVRHGRMRSASAHQMHGSKMIRIDDHHAHHAHDAHGIADGHAAKEQHHQQDEAPGSCLHEVVGDFPVFAKPGQVADKGCQRHGHRYGKVIPVLPCSYHVFDDVAEEHQGKQDKRDGGDIEKWRHGYVKLLGKFSDGGFFQGRYINLPCHADDEHSACGPVEDHQRMLDEPGKLGEQQVNIDMVFFDLRPGKRKKDHDEQQKFLYFDGARNAQRAE